MENAMRKILLAFLFLVFNLVEIKAKATETSFPEAIQKAKNSMVIIQTSSKDGKKIGLGSGFFIKDNLIVTAFHVINLYEDQKIAALNNIYEFYNIEVIFNDGEEKEKAQIVAFLPTSDLAILKVTKTRESLKISSVENDEKIFMCGFASLKFLCLTSNVVEKLSDYAGIVNNVILINDTVFPGMSGGPILNEKGEVVGIIIMYYRDNNVSYGIGINSKMIDYLLKSIK